MLSRLPAPEGPVTIWLGKYSGGPPSGQKVERMSKFWRVVAPVVAAGGLVAAGAMPAASASPTVVPTYSVSIAAHSAFPRISKHTLVIYKTKGFRTATISGTVTGAVTGDVATLWSEPFGANVFTATTSMVTLTPDGETPTQSTYTFSATPTRATAYEVKVTTGTTPDATSKPVTVFVTEGGKLSKSRTKCSSTSCTFSYKITEVLPASAYKTETHKHFYEYLAVGYPRLPGRYTLDKAATASRIRKINSGEFALTFTWHVTLHHGAANWTTVVCTKDSESKDGMGLPGRHSCGNQHISRKLRYLG